MHEIIEFDDFAKVELRVGQIIEVKPNEKARIPAYILQIDFGEMIGVKTSSAQLTVNYQAEDLLHRHVVCVMNFAAKRVAGVKSEVLVLGATSDQLSTKLIFVDAPIELGSKIA